MGATLRTGATTSAIASRHGAKLDGDGALFSVWAPVAREVVLVIEAPLAQRVTMQRSAEGFFSAKVANLQAGARYHYAIDARGPFADPASRFQPEGPHAASMLVDPASHHWLHEGLRGNRLRGQVVYEMHVGTFTRAGTFDAAKRNLRDLAELGVTLIEVMPIAEFPGRFNWGYDGVSLYAPYHGYGDYDAFKRFVDAAHGEGLAVILDVVYNHFGPDGAYHSEFSPYWFSDRYDNEWGQAINYDGDQSGPVREFAIDNASYWIDEFRLDGLRLDATQSIHDAGDPHVIAEISRAARAAAGDRSIVLIAENEPQDVRLLRSRSDGGFELDAMWNDDFHHAARVALTGRNQGYLHDYAGSPQEFVSAIRRGFLFQGQHYRWQQARRGTLVTREPAEAFIHFIQNHDQVANTPRGERMSVDASAPLVRALTALTLLGPQTPMLFMGQEIGATEPFPFFADFDHELAGKVFKGRRAFLKQFKSYASESTQACIPDPADAATFESAKLDIASQRGNRAWRMHRDLLRLRRTEPALREQSRESIEGSVIAAHAFLLRWLGFERDLLLVINLGAEIASIAASESLFALPRDQTWKVSWCSEHPDYGGSGVVSPLSGAGWSLLAQSATLLRADCGSTSDR